MIYFKSLECVERLDKWIDDIQMKLNKYPAGEFFISRNGNYFKWAYKMSKNSKKEYIPKAQRKVAENYAQKKLLTLLLDDLKHERMAIKLYLRHHKKRPWKSERLLTENPGYRELLLPTFRPMSERLAEWVKEPYEKSEKKSEFLKVKIPDGSFVRSKSEALIATVLFKYQIPFRYECALKLGDITYHPDFTIRHPRTGEIYYFEHLGMMDKKRYVQRNYNKLENYNLHGIVQGKNLITTFETEDKPLDIEYVEFLVKWYFL